MILGCWKGCWVPSASLAVCLPQTSLKRRQPKQSHRPASAEKAKRTSSAPLLTQRSPPILPCRRSSSHHRMLRVCALRMFSRPALMRATTTWACSLLPFHIDEAWISVLIAYLSCLEYGPGQENILDLGSVVFLSLSLLSILLHHHKTASSRAKRVCRRLISYALSHRASSRVLVHCISTEFACLLSFFVSARLYLGLFRRSNFLCTSSHSFLLFITPNPVDARAFVSPLNVFHTLSSVPQGTLCYDDTDASFCLLGM